MSSTQNTLFLKYKNTIQKIKKIINIEKEFTFFSKDLKFNNIKNYIFLNSSYTDPVSGIKCTTSWSELSI